MAENIFISKGNIEKKHRNKLMGHKGKVFWLFGLSGAGKSALSKLAEEKLISAGILCYRLDGDNLRSGLNSDLGFAAEDRFENIRRAAETAKLLADAGVVVLSAFITPLEANRKTAMGIIGDFYQGVYVKCDLDTCINRDPKGLYKKAMNNEIADFTGISAPFEPPVDNVMVIDTAGLDKMECANMLTEYILEKISLINKSEPGNYRFEKHSE